MSVDSKLPHYLAIKTELEARILSGRLAPGERLPSEEELSAEFGVSTSTVKRAIGVLVSDGLVERTPGRGTFVTNSPAQTPLRSFSEEMRERGLTPGTRLLEKKIIRANGELAWHLDIPENSQVSYVHRLRTADGVAVALDEAFIPYSICPDLLEQDLAALSLERLLEEKFHISLLQADEYVTARNATQKEAALLEAEGQTPVLLAVDRVVEGIARQRVLYNRTFYRADRYILHFQLKRFR